MSDGELSPLEVLRDLDQRRLTTEAAAQNNPPSLIHQQSPIYGVRAIILRERTCAEGRLVIQHNCALYSYISVRF